MSRLKLERGKRAGGKCPVLPPSGFSPVLRARAASKDGWEPSWDETLQPRPEDPDGSVSLLSPRWQGWGTPKSERV